MVYGAEAVLPADIAFRSPRVENFDESISDATRLDDIDRLEEERLVSCLWMTKYLEGLRRYHNRNFKV